MNTTSLKLKTSIKKCNFHTCKKKKSIYMSECRCGYSFCDDHQLNHSCTFDYFSFNKKNIADINIQAQFSKLKDKI